MIELKQDELVFSFPEVHPDATCSVDFQRTLRIPDDGSDYSLPPGLGCFPLCHVDDCAPNVPAAWPERGGVMLPMYQSEALWLNFSSPSVYPFALKIAAGKINAVNGDPWSNVLRNDRQDYVVVPEQPWLDGYYLEEGIIRQFVAMPLGSGYSAEEQLTGAAEHGGIQLLAFPMKAEVWEKRRELEANEIRISCADICYSPASFDMSLAPGGRMKQEIFDDPYEFSDWDTAAHARCFVHIANSLVWRQVTGAEAPTVPPTATEYASAGLPWFDYYDDSLSVLPGGNGLGGLKGIAELGEQKGDNPLPENQSVKVGPESVITIGKPASKDEVREGGW